MQQYTTARERGMPYWKKSAIAHTYRYYNEEGKILIEIARRRIGSRWFIKYFKPGEQVPFTGFSYSGHHSIDETKQHSLAILNGSADEQKKDLLEIIDLTPTWESTVKMCIDILRTPDAPPESIRQAQAELIKIGQLLDTVKAR